MKILSKSHLKLACISLCSSCSNLSSHVPIGLESVKNDFASKFTELEYKKIVELTEPRYQIYRISGNYYDYEYIWEFGNGRKISAKGRGGLQPFDPEKIKYTIK